MKRPKLLLASILLILIASCNKKNQNSNLNNDSKNSSIDKDDSLSVIVRFDTITTDNAPKRITRNIKLDSEGNLLIAAYDDIIRYDGDSFIKLIKPEGIDSWYAFDVIEDSNKNIWIASDQSGAFRIENTTGKITNFTTNDGLGHNRNMCVYEDKDGNVWIGGQGGLSKFNGNEFVNFTTEDGLPHNDINTILQDTSGNIWIGTRGNAGLYDGKTFYELKNDQGKAFFNVWSIIEDNLGIVWLVDNTGLWKYSDNKFVYASSDIWKIYQDTKGNFLSTGMLNGGSSVLKRIVSTSVKNETFKTYEIVKSSKMFFGIIEDLDGNIWIGGGNGIWRYNGNKLSFFTGVIPNND